MPTADQLGAGPARPGALPTPEARPDFYANVTLKRALAWVVDLVIVTLITLVAVVLTAFIGAFFFAALFFLISFFYRLMTIASGSATWGMRMMSIELRRLDGPRLSNQDALLHTLGYLVSVAIPVLQLASVVLMIVSRQGQGLTDHLLSTTAVNRQVDER